METANLDLYTVVLLMMGSDGSSVCHIYCDKGHSFKLSCSFFVFFLVLHTIREFSPYMETSPLPLEGFKFLHMLSAQYRTVRLL